MIGTLLCAAFPIYAAGLAILIPVYIGVIIAEFIFSTAIWVWLAPSLSAWSLSSILSFPLVVLVLLSVVFFCVLFA